MTRRSSLGPSRTWIVYVFLTSMVAAAMVWWDAHQDQQVTAIQDLGLAKDLQWLTSVGEHWLVRTPAGDALTLRADRQGFIMAADARLRIKSAANGKRWVCDADLQHCIRTADVQQSLMK